MASSAAGPGGSLPPGALAGVRVVDLTTVLMGPYAARMLGDHGADVIRVEPVTGDTTRFGHPRRSHGMSGYTLALQRNKRSVALDLKHPDGNAALHDIVATADVFLSNLRAAALERLGLEAAALTARHPGLVHCVANGFGSAGPYADKAAYDDAIQAASGLPDLIARATGGEPAYVPGVVADKITALHVVQAVLAALFHRERTGAGQAIEVPMFECLVSFNIIEHQRGAAFDPPEGSFGYERLLNDARRPFRTADGHACLLPYTDANWRDFLTEIGRTELIDHPTYVSHGARIRNTTEVYGLIADVAVTRTTAEWLAFCDRVSIPAIAVVDLEHAHLDPHLAAVGLLDVVDHPTEGAYRGVANPVTMAVTPPGVHRHAPRLGAHTAEVLVEAGWSADRIAAAVADGAAAVDTDPE